MSEMISKEMQIPKIRVGILVGKSGEIKRRIEKTLELKIDITKEGLVDIEGKDPLKVFLCERIVKAVGRGFTPGDAMNLTKENYDLQVLQLRDYGDTKREFIRLKGRVIGKEGKSRRKIEMMTGCKIVVFGKTVSIIGPSDGITLARKAVSMLLSGAKHGTVFRMFETRKKKG